MNKQIRKFRLLATFIEMELFYSIGISEYAITLQGKYSPELAKYLLQWFKFESGDNGYFKAVRNNIQVNLTD